MTAVGACAALHATPHQTASANYTNTYLYCSCRACTQLLVSAVAEAFSDCGGLAAVLEGVVRRWGEADAAAAAGKACWWQMREAGMLAVSTCSETAMVSSTRIDHTQLLCPWHRAE